MIRNIEDFAFDDQGRIGFLRQGSGDELTFVLITDMGQIVSQIPLRDLKPRADDSRVSRLAWVGGNRFLLIRSSWGEGNRASAWWIDVENSRTIAVPQFDCPHAAALAGFRDGRFVIVAGRSEGVYLFGKNGNLIRRIPKGQNVGPIGYASWDDAAFTTDGGLAIVNTSSRAVSVFTAEGNYKKTIDLTVSWKQMPNYPSRITSDVDGGFIVKDIRGTSSIVRMKADGTVLEELSARYADGWTDPSMQLVQVSPDGRLWTTDRHALIRLNRKGVADRVLGEKPNTDRLGWIKSVAVNTQGRIHAVDGRTFATHVFDADGKHLHVCRPDPTDFNAHAWTLELAVMPAGDVYLVDHERRGEILHFSPTGKRLGFERLQGDLAPESPISLKLFPRGPLGRWLVGYDDIGLINQAGRVDRIIDRSPNGNWFEHIGHCATSPKGSLAMLSTSYSGQKTRVNLLLYDEEGKPSKELELPFNEDAYSRLASDGEHIAITNQDQIQFLSPTGQPIGAFRPPQAEQGKTYNCPFLLPQQKQLWIYDGDRKIHRYAFP